MTDELKPFKVYRWQLEDTVLRLRYIASDGRGRCAFYDLDQSTKTRSQHFDIYPEPEILALLGSKIILSTDDERAKLPAEEDLTDERRAARASRWAVVERIFCSRTSQAVNEDEPVFTDAIYFEPTLLRKLMCREARRQGRKAATRLYELFWTCIRYGGDEYALTDHYNRSGARGVPRSTYEWSEKTGRRSSLYFRDPGAYAPENRFGPFWRRRTISAIVSVIACSPGAARELLQNPTQIRDIVLEDFAFAGGHMRVGERRKMPAAQIPVPRAIERHSRQIVARLADQISQLVPPRQSKPAGSSTDIALGDELIADMDVTDFKRFRIAFVSDNESAMRDLGAPRVALAVVRGSDYILGYSTTIGYECTELYQYCLLSMFTSKTKRLRELGFTERMEGMESGNVDVVLTDGGPGNSKVAKAFTFRDLKVDHAKAPPYFPQGKGNVEGSNYRVKGLAYSNMHLADGVFDKLIHSLKVMSAERRLALQHGQGLTPALKRQEQEGVIFLRERVFERILVEAINEHNLAVLTKKSALTQNIFARGEAPTRLAAFQEQKELRRGDRAYQRTEEEIRRAILRSMAIPATVLHGLVRVREGQYGGRENLDHENVKLLMKWESMERRKNGLGADKPIKITVSPSPHGNFILWLTEDREPLAIPPTLALRTLVGADADRSRIVAIQQWALADKGKDKAKRTDSTKGQSKKKFSKEASAESDRIKQRRGFEPPGAARPRSEAARTHRKTEAQKQYERNAAAAGANIAMPSSTIAEEESFFVRRLDDDDPYEIAELKRHLRSTPQ